MAVKTCLAAEVFQNYKAFVRPLRRPQPIGHLGVPGDARTEPDAVVGWNVVVHRFCDGDDLPPRYKVYSVTQGVVPADRDEALDTQPIEVVQDFRREIVLFCRIGALKMWRHAGFADLAGIRTRALEKRATGAPSARLTSSSVST